MKHLLFLITLLAVLTLVACGADDDEPKKKVGPMGESPNGVGPGPVDDDAPEAFTTTESGLKYRIRRKGDGPKPSPRDTVTVHYRGWLDDGKVFDSSYGKGDTVNFPLDGVIAGWTEGLQHVGEGGMIELTIPPDLGYGAGGAGPIPANATLHFIVELIKVDKAPEAPAGGAPRSRRSPETEAMLEDFVLGDGSPAPADEKVDGETPAAGEEEGEGDTPVE